MSSKSKQDLKTSFQKGYLLGREAGAQAARAWLGSKPTNTQGGKMASNSKVLKNIRTRMAKAKEQNQQYLESLGLNNPGGQQARAAELMRQQAPVEGEIK